MNYINPYRLLDVNATILSDIDPKALIKEKKKLLQEIELSDTETITHNGIQLTKSDCIRAIDEIDNPAKRDFHFFIFQNKDLNDFLSHGRLTFFEYFRTESIYKLPEFLDFVSPYFSFQYNRVLSKAFKTKNYQAVAKILSVKPITNAQYFESCYKSTYAIVRDIEDEVKSLLNVIENEESEFIETDFYGLDTHIKSRIDIHLINLLPSYFQSIRNDLANAIKRLAIHINNDPYSLYEPAFKLIEIANEIETEGLTRQNITKNYYTIKGNHSDVVRRQTTSTHYQPVEEQKPVKKPEEKIEYQPKPENNTVEEKKENKTATNVYTGFIVVVAACLLWAFFNQTVQKVILSLAALMYIVWIYNFIKKPQEYSQQGKIQALIYIISGAICIGAFFVPILTSLFLLYMFITFLHSFYNVTTSTKPPRASVGFIHLGIAIAAVALWYYVNQPVEPIVASSSVQDEKTTTPNSYESAPITSDIPPIDTSSTTNYSSNSTPNNYVPEPVFERVSVKNGNMPECSFTSRYNKQLNNKLVVSTLSSDAAIKMYNYETDKCIRYVFINKGTTYTIRNIPEGRYYLKIAYGDNWSVMQGDPICKGKFSSNALYKRGDEILDYNLHYTNNGYQIPSYSLTLTTTFTFEKYHNRGESEISENDFYNN